MIFGKRISELEQQVDEFRREIDNFGITEKAMFDQITDLKEGLKAHYDHFCELREEVEKFRSQIGDLKIIQKVQHDNYCELREEVEKLKRGMK